MSGRVAIVVGAGGELGRATAQARAGAGHAVTGVDRNEEGLKELPDGIRREVGAPMVLVNTIGTFRAGRR